MRSFPPLPDVSDSDRSGDLLDGHLWLLELIDGTGLRFRMDESGLLRFGDPERVFETVEAVPLALRPAIAHVRGRFDREALRDSVDDPAGIVFFGVATHHRGTDYEWDRIPPFLGTDVWSESTAESAESTAKTAGSTKSTAEPTATASDGASGAFRPPDAVAAIFDGVGLDSVNAIEREVNARDFDPGAYEIPESAWYDGPAAGVVVRNKRGGRGKMVAAVDDEATRERGGEDRGERGGEAPAELGDDGHEDPTALATGAVTSDRLERAADAIERRGEPVRVDALADRVVESVARETRVRFDEDTPVGIDTDRFRTAVAERARAFLDERASEW